MNTALIIAGGVGNRMGQDIPKQFLNVNDKPVIVYTMEVFQNHPDIDSIVIVCIDGWHEMLWSYARQFGISKLDNIVPGGKNGQDSIRNGLYAIAEKHCHNDDIVMIHDAIRPLVTKEIISDNLRVCREYGNATTVVPCNTAMLKTEEGNDVVSEQQVSRDQIKMTQTPQSFYLKDIVEIHKRALEAGITNSVASCTLYIEMNKKVYLSMGSEKNIKLTTTDDVEIFKALLTTKKEDWMH